MSGPTSMRPIPGTRERGVGIVEVLVALVVVSLGVLGIAGLQLTGMRHGTGSLNRTVALSLAEDLAERMRVAADAPAGLSGYAGFDSASQPATFCDAAPSPHCDAAPGNAAQSCTPAQLAAFDLAVIACGTGAWTSGAEGTGVIGGALPEGSFSVTCDATPCTASDTRTISVGWKEGEDEAGNDVSRSVTMRLRP